MSLYARLVLLITVLMLVTTGLLSWVLIRDATNNIIDTSRHDVEAVTTLLANASTYLWQDEAQVGRNAAMQALVDNLTGKGDIAFIRIVNEYNAVLAASTRPLPGYDRVTDDADWKLIALARRDGTSQSELTDDVLRAAAPLLDAQGEQRGAVFVYQSTERIVDTVRTATLRGLGLTGLAVLVGLVAAFGLARSVAQPVRRLSQAAGELAQGQWAQPLPASGVKEIHALGQAFSSMATQLQEIYTGLEVRVAERTQALERRAAQVVAGAEVSHAASQILDPEALLRYVVELIKDRFDLYYVAIFLLDETGQDAVLRMGTGEAGRIMLADQHKLAVGSNSMVGWVCANKRARIALDVGEEAIRFANPHLPETHSEMVLPLLLGERIIGALDVQSVRTQAFDESDVAAFQSMADQLVIALENARLFRQAQASLQELERSNEMLTGRGWEAFLRSRVTDFVEYHAPTAAPLTEETLPRLESETALVLPLQVRNQVIGRLAATRRADQPAWTAQDKVLLEAVAMQASQAIDSARLFEETQRRAAREQIIGEVTGRIRETLDMESMLRIAAEQMRQALDLEDLVVRLAAPQAAMPGTQDARAAGAVGGETEVLDEGAA
ncbi:MAG: GAF domain-containing protein [Anaerolineae bacterium]